MRTILQPYDDATSGERIGSKQTDILVGATAVTSLALALHESATNAVKYGALSEPDGAIRITWHTLGDASALSGWKVGGPALVAS